MLVIYALLGLLVATDTGMTIWALNNGFHEVAWGAARNIPLTISIDLLRIGVGVAGISVAMKQSKFWGWVAAIGFIALAAYPVIRNAHTLGWL